MMAFFGRRGRVAMAAGAALMVALGASGALAQDPISDVLRQQNGEWSEGFDVGNRDASEVRTATPILSTETLATMELAIQTYEAIVAQGGWPIVPAEEGLKIGMRHPAVPILRQRLIVTDDLPKEAGYSDSFDSYVQTAVRHFQARHGIPADGIVGPTTFAALNVPAQVRLNQLHTNLQRLRELLPSVPARFVMVNIPGAAVEAVENDTVQLRHTAIVGKVDRPSPILATRIVEVNFNPFWTVPASIIRKDLIPLMQKNPNYLTEQHIRIYNQQGTELPPQQVNWNSDEATNYMFRQDPGDFNSLGHIRMNVISQHGVYMHDTPNKTLFGDEYRFESSGCVRVQNIQELVNWMLRDTPGWGRAEIESAVKSGQRIDVRLNQPMPVFWTYLTAWSMGDRVVHFRNDIYLQDGIGDLALR